MLYYINYRKSFLKKFLKDYACKRTPDRYEIYVFGNQIMNSVGKSTWNGTGPARNALRLMLGNILGYDQNKTINTIMKSYVGLDDSYPIYIKKV